MSNRKKADPPIKLNGKILVELLQKRALELAEEHYHDLEPLWTPAKKKYGKSATATACKACKMKVVVLPGGYPQLKLQTYRRSPAIIGLAVTTICDDVLKLAEMRNE